MKTLIVEDDYTSRLLLNKFLKDFGPAHMVENGAEAVDAVQEALEKGDPFDLICMDIMMPEMDGQAALKQIRIMEEQRGIFSTDGAKIVMTTALKNMENLSKAFGNLCDAYLVKPINRNKLVSELKKLGLISD